MTTTTKAWLHSIIAAAVGGFASSGLSVLAMPDVFNTSSVGWHHIFISFAIGTLIPVFSVLKQSPLPDSSTTVTNTSTVTKTSALLLAMVLVSGLSGCVPAQTKQAAQAAQNAAIVVQTFQQGEIIAHNQHLIPDADHVFIQDELITLARAGKATDACIGLASTKAVTVGCVNAMITTIDQINQDGGLHLKSERAKTDFNVAMVGVKSALQVITTMMQ